MTLRERIADWISGGALRQAQYCADTWKAAFEMEQGWRRKEMHGWFSASSALNRIAACETEKANATVRRMAKIAREAME